VQEHGYHCHRDLRVVNGAAGVMHGARTKNK
jgi:hypothetical protein